MPARAPRFSATGRIPGSYDVEASAGVRRTRQLEMYARATRVLPGGTDSNFRAWDEATVYVDRGEGGLVWSLRLEAIHQGLTSGGARGFPERAARYLGARYGYHPSRVDGARARILDVPQAERHRVGAGRRRHLVHEGFQGEHVGIRAKRA